MNKLAEWKLAQKIQASGRKGVVVGLSIAALICLVVAAVILKARLLNKGLGCFLGETPEGEAEEGCCYTNEKDFV